MYIRSTNDDGSVILGCEFCGSIVQMEMPPDLDAEVCATCGKSTGVEGLTIDEDLTPTIPVPHVGEMELEAIARVLKLVFLSVDSVTFWRHDDRVEVAASRGGDACMPVVIPCGTGQVDQLIFRYAQEVLNGIELARDNS